MIELCGRAKNGGGKCEAPALRGKSFCYYHDPRRQGRAKAFKVRYFLELTMLEPGAAVRAAISETVQALAQNEIDCEYGGRLLYALQLAWNGKKLGGPPVNRSSPRYIRIAPAPGFTKVYCTSRQPDRENLRSPRPVELPGRLPAVNAVSTSVTSWNRGICL